jgi:iron complex outermembrane receptor protein
MCGGILHVFARPVSAASLTISVTDATGAALVDATVTVIPTTGAGRSLRSDTEGHALFTDVANGPAAVRVERLGFRPRELTVDIAEGTATLGVQLSVAVDEAVVVEGAAPGYRAVLGSTALKLPNVPARDVPFTVDAVPSRVLEDQHVTAINDALRNVGSVGQQVGFGGMNGRQTIRGFVPQAQLKNGFRQNVFTPLTDMANVEQVEVLKGPASALYGSFEPGGIVNLVTKRPLEQPHYAVDLSGGSFQTYRTTADLGGPIAGGDKVLYRLNAAYTTGDSHRDFITRKAAFIAPVIELRLSASTTVLAEVEYLNHSGGFDRGFGNNAIVLTLPRQRNLGEPSDRADADTTVGRVLVTHHLTDKWALRTALMASRANADETFFSTGTPLVSGSNYNRRAAAEGDRQTDIGLQAELFGAVTTGRVEHRLLAGTDYADDDWTFSIARGASSAINMFAPSYGAATGTFIPSSVGEYRNQSFGLYGQDLIALGSKWKALVGARLATVASQADITLDTLLGAYSVDRRVTNLAPRGGLTFQPLPELSLYASVARSFRAIVDSRIVGGGLPDPSLGTQVEGGVKADLLGGQLSTTASVFTLKREKTLVANPDDPFGPSLQTGEQTVNGFELEATLQPIHGWNTIASFSRLDASVTRDTTIRLGTRLVNVPTHSGSVWSTYTVPRGAARGAGGGIGLFHVGDRAANATDTFDLPAYTRWDATLFYAPARWRIAANFYNLSDTLYWESGGGFVVAYPGPPRSFSRTAGVRF